MTTGSPGISSFEVNAVPRTSPDGSPLRTLHNRRKRRHVYHLAGYDPIDCAGRAEARVCTTWPGPFEPCFEIEGRVKSKRLRCSAYDLFCRVFAGPHSAFHKSMHLGGVFATGPVNAACRFAQCGSVIREHAGSEVSYHSSERPFFRGPIR